MSEKELVSRRARLAALREKGIDPYPARVGPRQRIVDVRRLFDDRDTEALESDPQVVAVVGRVIAVRSFGKLIFLQIFEDGAEIQASAKKKEIDGELFDRIRDFEVGDFVWVEGPIWRTRTGELTVDVRAAQIAAKSLRPLPEKWHGLSDVETRTRQRYLDLLSNEETRRVVILRSRTISAMRAFLDSRGFLEVETPVLQPIYGGAAAEPFVTHHNRYEQRLYLRISDELYLKRLVVGGLDRVYEIGHNFRNEGISRKHNPEFTMMECYQAYADYRDMMDLAEEMIGELAAKVCGTRQIEYRGAKLDLSAPWPRVPLCEAIREATQIDVLEHDDLDSLREAMRSRGLDPAGAPTWAKLVDDLFSDQVEPGLIQPMFITDHPLDLSPLAKRSAADPRLAERFEPYMAGMEIGNAFSELNDPDDQRARLTAQQKAHAAGDSEAHPLDEDYVTALEHGLPPTGGLGIGVDRLVMILADVAHLREVILFPHLRPRSSEASEAP
ncbi:MAG: lysine--tRNA ligase [Myxococcota bacterium]